MNVLGRASSGRLSFYGGGGPGYWQHGRRFTETVSGCEPSVAPLCGTNENTFNSSALTVQGYVPARRAASVDPVHALRS